MDLHNLPVSVALLAVREVLTGLCAAENAHLMRELGLIIVVGVGSHSVQEAQISPAVKSLLTSDLGVQFGVVPHNPGRLFLLPSTIRDLMGEREDAHREPESAS